MRGGLPIICAITALAVLSCSKKPAPHDPIYTDRPRGVSACDSLDPFQEGFDTKDGRRYHVIPSDSRITVQLDTAYGPLDPEGLIARHESLLRGANVIPLERGYYTYYLADGWGYEAAFSELWADRKVNRVEPVYIRLDDRSEFQVTDLIDVQFRVPLGWMKTAGKAMERYNLLYVSRDSLIEGRWAIRLDDNDNGSPLGCGTGLNYEVGVVWAEARRYPLAPRQQK